MSRHPQLKKRITGDQPGAPPSQKREPTQLLSLWGLNAANGKPSQPLGHGKQTGIGLNVENLKTDAEEDSELKDFHCETSENALLYLAADDSYDPDWPPPHSAKKVKRKTNDPTTARAPSAYGRGPDVMSKSERTQRRYRKAWQGQKKLDAFFVTPQTIPRKRSPPESSTSDDDSDGDDGVQTEPEVAVRKNPPTATAAAGPTHPDSEP